MTHLKKEIKDNVRKKFHWTCLDCHEVFAKKDHDKLTVHHVNAPMDGEHLIPLCQKCHEKREKKEKESRRMNYLTK